ncbi:hypothetical protein BKA70DRAFT_1260572 [Coprinopsis sp. MPI-PUGE-AT-0042]|nr:hypothetical protein BKA70DRAFT_1260572 [Coprinopsis sp. MPI-PUGE-AT-0042]
MAYPQYASSQGSWAAAPSAPYATPGQPSHISIQPQSSWGGADYYRAHAPSNYDPAYYNNAWDRVRQFDNAAPAGLGVGVHEAKHWHRRAYGGMSELNIMGPSEIGHAAAYEAYRTCRTMYEMLGPDIERQRERLIGLAVAEAARLLSFTGRANDHYARSAASDAAAHTASYIFYQRRTSEGHRGRSRAGSSYGDEYDSEGYYDEEPYGHRGRSRSRHRSAYGHGRSYSAGGYPGDPYAHGSTVPVEVPSAYPGAPAGVMMQPPGSGGGYSSGYSTGGYYPNTSYYQQPSAGPYGGYGAPAGQMYPTPGVPVGVPMAPSSSTSSGYSYGGAPPYMGMPSGGGTIPGQTIVIHKNRKHHRSRRRHRSRSRYADSE